MVKNKSGDIVLCRYCESENLSIAGKGGIDYVFLGCSNCGKIYPVFNENSIFFRKESACKTKKEPG